MQNISKCPDCNRKLIAEELDSHVCPDTKAVRLEARGRPVLIRLQEKTILLLETADDKMYAIFFDNPVTQIETPPV